METVVAEFETPFHSLAYVARKTKKILKRDNLLFIGRETFLTIVDF